VTFPVFQRIALLPVDLRLVHFIDSTIQINFEISTTLQLVLLFFIVVILDIRNVTLAFITALATALLALRRFVKVVVRQLPQTVPENSSGSIKLYRFDNSDLRGFVRIGEARQRNFVLEELQSFVGVSFGRSIVYIVGHFVQ
jgi:hypothetical protein